MVVTVGVRVDVGVAGVDVITGVDVGVAGVDVSTGVNVGVAGVDVSTGVDAAVGAAAVAAVIGVGAGAGAGLSVAAGVGFGVCVGAEVTVNVSAGVSAGFADVWVASPLTGADVEVPPGPVSQPSIAAASKPMPTIAERTLRLFNSPHVGLSKKKRSQTSLILL